jgi:hypothetical protein
MTLRAALLLALVWAAGCGAPAERPSPSPPRPRQIEARPKRCRAYTYFEQQGVAQLVTGATCNAVMIWPAEMHDAYIADLEREVEAYRRAPWGGQ